MGFDWGLFVKKVKLVRIVSVPHAFVHIEETLRLLNHEKFEITLISSKDEYLQDYLKKFPEGAIHFKEVPMAREIAPFSDLLSVIRLAFFLRKYRPDIIHSSTPKAGIITSIAALIAQVPLRFHTFTGQRWATLTGLSRSALKLIDHLIIKLNSETLADSPSQVEYLNENGLRPIDCLMRGSFGGVDLVKFSPESRNRFKLSVMNDLNIPSSARVALFLGRINKDKGVDLLLESFSKISGQLPDCYLVFVGPYEKENNPLSIKNENIMMNHAKIRFLGMKNDPVPFLAIADFLVLPSFREGFGTVVIEAAGMEIPTLGRKISGLVDSISHDESGLLFESDEEFELQFVRLFKDTSYCVQLGERARTRALKYFDGKILARAQLDFYRSKLAATRNSQIETIVEKS